MGLTAADIRSFSRLIDVNDRGYNLIRMGEGTPPVVMEAAIGDFSLTWSLVQPEVARFTTVVTYDRAGLGWSESSPKPRTGEVMMEELRALLDAAAIQRPVILVGHSFSGLLVRLYAYKYPEEVAGLVLVDGSHEDQFQRFPPEIGQLFPTIRATQVQQLIQMSQTIRDQGSTGLTPLVIPPAGFDNDLAAIYVTQSVAQPAGPLTMAGELEELETTQAQVRTALANSGHPPLKNMPLRVLSHGIPQAIPGLPDEINQAYEKAASVMQEEMAKQSRRGRRLIVENAGHMIHHDQPEAVVKAIRSIFEEVRAK
jgi:pimeloyl-ACP methyl ester carboxylesterase